MVLRDILLSVCRGMHQPTLEQLVAQAQFGVVRNSSRQDGQFAYFAGYVQANWSMMPASLGRRWLPVGEL